MEEIFVKAVDRVPDLVIFAAFAWITTRGFFEYLKDRDTKWTAEIITRLESIKDGIDDLKDSRGRHGHGRDYGLGD